MIAFCAHSNDVFKHEMRAVQAESTHRKRHMGNS